MGIVDKRELMRLREKINAAKQELSEAKGQRTQLLTQLKEEFGCNNSKQAEKLMQEIKDQVQDLQTKLDKAFEQLDSEFEHLKELA